MSSTTTEAIERLGSKSSRIRRSGAKRLRKAGDSAACPALLSALEKELGDPRTWETQYQLIVALGECRCQQALPMLQELAHRQFEATMVYSAIGQAMVTLSSERGAGISTVRELLELDVIMLAEGALRAMACLRLVAEPQEIAQIIKYVKKLPNFSPAEGGSFIKVWVAAAAAGWEESAVRSFLLKCRKSDNQQLVRAAEASLRRQYLKWYPL